MRRADIICNIYKNNRKKEIQKKGKYVLLCAMILFWQILTKKVAPIWAKKSFDVNLVQICQISSLRYESQMSV